MNRLHKKLPSYYKKSEPLKEITEAEDQEFDRVYDNIEDLNKQFLVGTATWGLSIYEKVYGLPIKPDKSLGERRSIILSKMRGIGKVDNLMLEAIVEAFTGVNAKVDFNGRIQIEFINKDNFVISKDLTYAINEVKPAHLGFDYVIREVCQMILECKGYSFEVFYRICNRFKTAQIKTGIMRNEIDMKVKGYDFKVNYPICGKFSSGKRYGKRKDRQSTEFNKIPFNRF